MSERNNVVYRFRVPVVRHPLSSSLQGTGRRRTRKVYRVRRRHRLRGGFLPALIPLIAAAIGAVPGIASVALQASRGSH